MNEARFNELMQILKRPKGLPPEGVSGIDVECKIDVAFNLERLAYSFKLIADSQKCEAESLKKIANTQLIIASHYQDLEKRPDYQKQFLHKFLPLMDALSSLASLASVFAPKPEPAPAEKEDQFRECVGCQEVFPTTELMAYGGNLYCKGCIPFNLEKDHISKEISEVRSELEKDFDDRFPDPDKEQIQKELDGYIGC